MHIFAITFYMPHGIICAYNDVRYTDGLGLLIWGTLKEYDKYFVFLPKIYFFIGYFNSINQKYIQTPI